MQSNNNDLVSSPYQNLYPGMNTPQGYSSFQPPAQQTVLIPSVPPDIFYSLKDSEERNTRLAVEVERLKQQQHMKMLKEEAYTNTFINGKGTYTTTESGRYVELLDTAITSAFQLIPHGPVEHPVRYGLEFRGHKRLIILDRSDYLDDKLLIHNIQTAGIRVTTRRSLRTTAALIRHCISAVLVTVRADFYGGWKISDQGPVFLRFQKFSSHQGPQYLEVAQPTAEVTPVAATIVVKQFSQMLHAIRSPDLRWLLFAWFHASFLFSLLRPSESALPLGLCLYTQEPLILQWMERLFCWYDDPIINLDDRPVAFSKAMWHRKDQPAVLIDHHQTENACRNTLLLEEILATMMVAWKDGRRETTIPLQASVVVLCDTVSSLCCSPKFLTLDIQAEDLDLNLCRRQLEQAPVHYDYLQALASYTTAHWSQLQEFLRQGQTQAADFATTADILTEAGTLLGVVRFAETFCRFYGEDDMPALVNRGMTLEAIQALFDQMAPSISRIDAAYQFCRIAQRCMAAGIFSICDTDRDDSDGSSLVVYLIGEDYGFPSAAFRAICRYMSQSTPVIAQALSEAGFLRGKQTNKTTVQTRIPVTNVSGIHRYVGVYRIAQEYILNEIP